jgi:hypothetical protein
VLCAIRRGACRCRYGRVICERERRSREEYAERTSELVAAHATADKQGLARDNYTTAAANPCSILQLFVDCSELGSNARRFHRT